MSHTIRSGARASKAVAIRPSQVQITAVSSRKLRFVGRRGIDREDRQPEQQVANERRNRKFVGGSHAVCLFGSNLYAFAGGPSTMQVFPPPIPCVFSRMRLGRALRGAPWI